MQPLLSIKSLSIQFSNDGELSTAVKNVSFDIYPGEIVAIVGESGSGKSVTALSVLRLLPAQTVCSGEILFYQKDGNPVDLLKLPVTGINAVRGKDIAMIFQEPMTSLNPVFTCGHQVMEAIRLHQKVSKETAKQKNVELFDRVKLPEPASIINRYPHQLSGGQKQRVMIAMAMSCNPSLLIADEPTTALDVTVQKTILELIKELQEQTGMGVIFITHDLGLVADIADTRQPGPGGFPATPRHPSAERLPRGKMDDGGGITGQDRCRTAAQPAHYPAAPRDQPNDTLVRVAQ